MLGDLRTPGDTGDRALAFRFAHADDVTAIVDLVESAYRGESSRAGWTTEADLLDGQRTDAEAIRSVLAGPGSAMLLAEANGQLVGCCQLEQPHPPPTAPALSTSPFTAEVYFGMFAVRPGCQGRGWGRQILAEAEHVARDEWSARTMVLSVLAQRPDLIAWYERRGYRRTGETRPFPYWNERFGVPKRPDLSFAVLAKPLVGPAAWPAACR
jgi:ribosomal protein S18 acetylase RimI-like enzyme